MGEVQVITLNKCLDFTKAITLIEKNDLIPPKTMHKLTRLNDYSSSPVKSFRKIENKAAIEVNKKIQEQQELSMKAIDDVEKRRINTYIQILSQDHNLIMSDLLDTEEKDFKIPEFTLSEFIAKEDIPSKNIKAGQSLVPQQFFTLMGSGFINDDTEVKK